jgi:hypothetical protein
MADKSVSTSHPCPRCGKGNYSSTSARALTNHLNYCSDLFIAKPHRSTKQQRYAQPTLGQRADQILQSMKRQHMSGIQTNVNRLSVLPFNSTAMPVSSNNHLEDHDTEYDVSSDPVLCTCALHLCSVPVLCTCALHLCSAPVLCTCALFLLCTCFAPVLCTCALHLCSAPVLCTCALHLCSASQNLSWYLAMFISSDHQFIISRNPGKFGKKCISAGVRIHYFSVALKWF